MSLRSKEDSRDNGDATSKGHNTTTVFPRNGQLHAQFYSSLITTHSNTEKSPEQKCSFPLGWINKCSIPWSLKSLIAEAQKRSLRFYNRNLPLTVQADASKHGLGAALLQQGQPVAFASKSLSDTEKRYANIERELLSVVFACEHFQTYLLGREFTIESDHKPLEMIALKNLVAAPPRLQRMLLRLQPFDCSIKYKPGKEMLLADTLSRLPSPANTMIELDMRIDHHGFTTERIRQIEAEKWLLTQYYP